MKIRVLVDNMTKRHTYGEWGLSFYIEDENYKILFDVGRTDLFLKNAAKFNIDIKDIDCVVLSHGHFDHTHGMKFLLNNLSDINRKKDIVFHPFAISDKIDSKGRKCGCDFGIEELKPIFNIKASKEPVSITKNIIFLGEIERVNGFESKSASGKAYVGGRYADDFLLDDSALVYNSPEGIVIIVGCSHSGICNTIEYAKRVTGNSNVLDVIGGFHLMDKNAYSFGPTLSYFKNSSIKKLTPCHCTYLEPIIELSKLVEVTGIGVGSLIEY